MPFSGVERGPWGLLTAFSRVAPRVVCAGALSSPSRWGWRLLHRRERPAVSGELARDRDHDDRAGLASGLERVPASVEPAGAAVRLRSQGEGFAFAPAFEGDAQARRAALVPGGLNKEPARVRVAGLGDPALAAPLPARVLARGEAEERAERLGAEPAPVAELDGQRERRKGGDASEPARFSVYRWVVRCCRGCGSVGSDA